MLVVPEVPDTFSFFAESITIQKYAHDKPDNTKESFGEICLRVPTHVLRAVDCTDAEINAMAKTMAHRKFLAGGRYQYASGRPYHQVQNCILTRAEDSREGWGEHLYKAATGLMSGAGLGSVYSDLREKGARIVKTGGTASGPVPLMLMTNEAGRGFMQGGSRRSAIWAGLHWWHPDIMEFIRLKDWSPEIRALKAKDFNFPAPMDMTNISVILDTEFFLAYANPVHPKHPLAVMVYRTTVRQMLKTGEPGFSIDCGVHEGENLRNACTEVVSRDDSDICNLGSINMARMDSLEEMEYTTWEATKFLLAGTVYSDVPYPKIKEIRDKNRRLGLGLMGLHEFLLKRGKKYGPDAELTKYLEIYRDTSDRAAVHYAKEWGISAPIARRAIAPTGTLGIEAETTTGIEPILCAAYKRRYLKGTTWNYQYVIDPTAQRIIDQYGVAPESIEDAYSLAEEPERRLAFQAYVQEYVDQAISSTLNLPEWGSELNNDSRVSEFGDMLMKYLPRLRGMTCYPDGARGGQPLTPVLYRTAKKHLGQVFQEAGEPAEPSFPSLFSNDINEGPKGPLTKELFNEINQLSDEEAARPLDVCDLTKAGSCGS